jgi:hypothetical protein
MKTLQDNGMFRCLRFDKGGSFNMHFNLTTWPGYLCISGDMGCFVFSRLDDMFDFFRTEPRKLHDGTQRTLPINPSYWGEKAQAVNPTNGMKVFDMDRFRECVKEDFDAHFLGADDEFEDADDSDEAKVAHLEAKAECWEAIEREVLELDWETLEGAHRAAHDFEHEGFSFQDFYEHDMTAYAYHFIWCLYAITWGIRQYDASKAPAQAEA